MNNESPHQIGKLLKNGSILKLHLNEYFHNEVDWVLECVWTVKINQHDQTNSW